MSEPSSGILKELRLKRVSTCTSIMLRTGRRMYNHNDNEEKEGGGEGEGEEEREKRK